MQHSVEKDAPAVEVWDASVPPGGFVCSLCGRPTESEPCEHLMPAATYNVTRFACRCGRFLADSGIRHTDHRDDSRYYGIRSEVEWDCSRCGTVKGEELEPQIVVTATRVLPPGHGVEDVDDFLTAYDSQPGIDTTVLPPGSTA